MLLLYWGLKGDARRWALLLGSYFFYGWWDWRFCGLLGLSTVVDYCCALWIEQSADARGRKRILTLSVVTSLGILGTFKYFNFFRDSARTAFGALGIDLPLPVIDVVLPAGISFYTFQTMSYTIDVYRGLKAERSFRDFALSIACFAHLVAGPIVRARDLMPQFKIEHRFGDVDFSACVYRLFRGLFKKMVVADALALYVDAVFAEPSAYSGVGAWIALYAYAFQIYMDFSGYSDVALASASLLGLKFPENFDSPYLAVSPSDFWRRWHITLSTWLRDYLYIPLGGSRGTTGQTIRILMITMTLGGLWHGAAWTFVAWGVYHGVLLVGERLLFGPRRRTVTAGSGGGANTLAVIVMFHLTCLGWLLFRAPDWQIVLVMLRSMTDFSAGELHGLRIALVVLACAIAHAHPLIRTLPDRFARLPAFGQGALAAVCMWSLLLLSTDGKPFIYFQF
jgi:alginate O-acetyltransferase complex protein AlgI